MKQPILISAGLSLLLASTAYGQEIKFHGSFTETFQGAESEYFDYNYRRSGEDFRYFSGFPSLSEDGTNVMMYRIDPEDPAGAGRGL